MSEDIESAGVTWSILDDHVEMQVIPRDEGDLRVRFVDDDDDVLWSTVFESGFWKSRTKRGEIGNKLAQNTSFAKSDVKTDLENVWTDLAENEEEYEARLVSPSVEQLIDNTVRVETYGGEEREIQVWVRGKPKGHISNTAETDGGADVRRLQFTNSEWIKRDGDTQVPPVVREYSNAFYEMLDITWQEWREDIRPHWEAMQEIVSDDQLSTDDRIAMSVTRSLRHKLNVYADRSKIINDSWNGWFDSDPNSQDGEVVWVTGDTLDEALDQHDKGIDYRSPLSRALKNQGYTSGTRQQTTVDGDRVELYPFLPEVVGIEEPSVDVIGLEDDDDDDDDTADAGDDGGDGGDDSGGASQEGHETNGDEETIKPEDADSEVQQVVKVVSKMDPTNDLVPRKQVVMEASQTYDIGPPDDVDDLIERAILEDLVLQQEDGDTQEIGVQPEMNVDSIDTDEEGVPDA